MKKFIVLLLALTMMVGAVFAQAAVNGYERAYTSIADGSVTLTNRLRLNISFDDPDGNYGAFARLRLQFNDLSDTDGAIDVRYAYAWVKLGGKVKVTAGELGNYDYEIDSGISDIQLGNFSTNGWLFDQTLGTLVQFYPVEGLDIGVAMVSSAADLSLANLSLNAKYDIKDVGSVIVSTLGADDLSDAMASALFQFTGVKDLSVAAGYKYNAGDNNILGALSFSAGELSFEVTPIYNLTASQLYVEGYASYASGKVQLNVLGAYDDAGDTLGSATDPSTYFFGGEFLYMPFKNTTLTLGFYYDDFASWSIPVIVKVDF